MRSNRRSRLWGSVPALATCLLVGVPPAAADGPAGGRDARIGRLASMVDLLRERGASSTGDGAAPHGRFAEMGCFDDAASDVVIFEDSRPPADFPRVDITRHCVTYTGTLALAVDVAEPTDPLADPNWEGTDGATFVGWLLEVTGDDESDYAVVFDVSDGALAATVVDADSMVVCSVTPEFDGSSYIARDIPAFCIGSADSVRVSAEAFYQEATPEAPIYLDAAPDVGLDGPVARTTAPLQCPNVADIGDPGGQEGIRTVRVACGVGGTEPISQAVAVSEALSSQPMSSFEDGSARHAIIARNDAFPDALAGSALGFGLAPLLFTHSPASAPTGVDPDRLAASTRNELRRVLLPGGDVYLLGGTVALGAGLDTELAELGYNPIRLDGANRFATAEIISAEVRRIVGEYSEIVGFPDLNSVMLATGANWVDAVAAGQVASYWGFPVLLTERDRLPDETIRGLAAINPEYIYVVGGTVVVSEAVRDQIRSYAGPSDRVSHCPGNNPDDTQSFSCRVFGTERVGTAVAVGRLNRFLFEQFQDDTENPLDAQVAVAVNLRREPDGFAHVLSASVLSGYFRGVFLPIEGSGGTEITTLTEFFACDKLRDLDTLLLAGDTDLLADDLGDRLAALLENGCPDNPG